MDRVDREILAALEDDGKAGLKAIARKVGVPTSTAHHRIMRMEKNGVIRKYSAIPDYRKVGLPVCAYLLVNVSYSGISSQEEVARHIRKIPNILSVDIVSGEIDIIAKVRAEDIDSLGDTVIRRIRKIPGVAKTVTSVVMKNMD